MKSIEERVLSRIYGSGRGHVFTPKDFLDLGKREGIGQALVSLVKKGTIRRLSRGLYDYPRTDEIFGAVPPSPDQVAGSLMASQGAKLQATGAYAANILGLSEQLPAKFEYLTEADDRTIELENRTIRLRRTTPRNMKMAGRASGLVTQAFRYLGKDQITPRMVEHLRKHLSDDEKKQLAKDIALPPSWIGDYFREIIAQPRPKKK